MSIESNLRQVQARIAAACQTAGRDPRSVTLVAVSKTHPAEAVVAAWLAGQAHFGENRVQEMVAKQADVASSIRSPLPPPQWHMIGTLQTNKIRLMAGFVDWIHSVASEAALREVGRRAEQHGRVINVLLQVNISDEDQKSGCEPDELSQLLQKAASLPGLRVRGLMGMASVSDDPETVRPQFALLRRLRDDHRHLETETVTLHELSMGMSHDLEAAILEGATMVRVGTAIFGGR